MSNSHASNFDESAFLPGDHLWIRLHGYTHHGLYLGENDDGQGLVIHYAGWVRGFRAGPLEITSLEEFHQNRRVHVRDYRQRIHDRASSIDRALSRLGEEDYDVHSNNCEHFCYWAIMGDHRSPQVEKVDLVLGAIHPGLEAISKSLANLRQPGNVRGRSGKKVLLSISKDLLIDWGVKSTARWIAGPYGVVAYVGYRVTKEVLKQR